MGDKLTIFDSSQQRVRPASHSLDCRVGTGPGARQRQALGEDGALLLRTLHQAGVGVGASVGATLGILGTGLTWGFWFLGHRQKVQLEGRLSASAAPAHGEGAGLTKEAKLEQAGEEHLLRRRPPEVAPYGQ